MHSKSFQAVVMRDRQKRLLQLLGFAAANNITKLLLRLQPELGGFCLKRLAPDGQHYMPRSRILGIDNHRDISIALQRI